MKFGLLTQILIDFQIFFKLLPRAHTWAQILVWCDLGQTRFSGIGATTAYVDTERHTDIF